MAKIVFNNKNYNIDESAIAPAATELQSHLSAEMNGGGAKIIFGGTEYGIDSTKLSAEVADFIAHLQTIAGEGLRVVVGGVEYNVDPSKVASAVADLGTAFDGLSAGGGDDPVELVAGLYRNNMMIKSWDDLLAEGIVHVDNGNVYTNMDTNTWVNSSADVLVGDLMLPNDESITTLLESAFDSCTGLTSIAIPDSVTSIGQYALYGCSGLANITYNGTVAQWNAVSKDEYWSDETGDFLIYCTDATVAKDGSLIVDIFKIAVTDDDTSCTIMGLADPTKVTELVIPQSVDRFNVTSIGDYAFQYCESLTSITIPNSVTSIGAYAFDDCNSLTSVTLPASVTTIGEYAFKDLYIDELHYLGTVEQWCNMEFTNHPRISNLYINNELIEELVIPGTVKEIKENAFHNCFSITKVTILDGVTTVGYGAFYNCINLTTVEIPSSVTSWNGYAFLGCEKLETVYYNGTLEQLCNIDFTGSGLSSGDLYINGEQVTGDFIVPDTITEIKPYTFYNFDGVTSVTIPEGVTSIGNSAFSASNNLTSIAIPNSVTTIGKNAFSSCTQLTSFVCNEGSQLSSIGTDAFYRCTALKNVVLPEGLTAIPSDAFENCSALESITIPASVTEIGSIAFYNCSSLASIMFGGTTAQWKAVTKGTNWNKNTGTYTVYCSDGTVSKSNVVTPNS